MSCSSLEEVRMTTGNSLNRSSVRIRFSTSRPDSPGHLQVQQDQLRQEPGSPPREFARAVQVVEGLDAIVDDHNWVCEPVLGEGAERQLHIVQVVVDQQDRVLFCFHGAAAPRRSC